MREKLRSKRENVISLPKSWDSRRNHETRQVWDYWMVILYYLLSPLKEFEPGLFSSMHILMLYTATG